MRQKLRRGGALLCALCLLLCLAPRSGRAVVLTGVYFTAVNDQLMEMDQATMPFWSGGKLYVSSRVFEVYREELGITYSPGTDRKTFALYTGRSALLFDLAADACYDNRGNLYAARAVDRNGNIFFPLDTVCPFFGLTYSYTATALVPLVRIRSGEAVLSDSVFIDAASSLMRSRYNAYVRSVTEAQEGVQTPEPEEPVSGNQGQRVSLAVVVTEEEAALAALNSFTLYQTQGTFLLTAEQATRAARAADSSTCTADS